MTAYVAGSAASAPAPRGLPLSVQAPSRHSAVVAGTRPSSAADVVGGSSDDWDEAAPPVSPPTGGGDDDGPPLEELEAQMHGDVAAQASAESPRSARRASRSAADEEDDARGSSAALPELDDLVARLPTDVRETLDELFRARFVLVKKLPARVFSPAVKTK